MCPRSTSSSWARGTRRGLSVSRASARSASSAFRPPSPTPCTTLPADASDRCRSLLNSCCSHGSRLAPVQNELAFGEIPATVEFDEAVEVAQRRDHDLADAILGVDMVGDRVALAGGAVPVDGDRALAVEVRRCLVAIEVVEDGCERFASVQDVARLAAFPIHVDGEAGVLGEERLLSFGVAAVGAVRVRIEELAES